ncbi:MAG: DNA phosphorothioation-associated DGQHR protein 1 [Rhodocyclales bacterium]|nr:DNA phosphorothioation-associated DGQHR protein 1 [Rhodocyclales bacterium]
MPTYPIKVPALRVKQPIGVFYVVSLPARVLLDTAYSDRLRATRDDDKKTYVLEGSQRELHEPRLKDIGAYIDTEESAFPNSIILAPNFDENTGFLIEEESDRWIIATKNDPDSPDGETHFLVVPSEKKLAPIIDGQHRLFGFNFAERPDRLDTELVCSVFLDLPKPYQAFLFATINSTQKPVPKSLTYDLFGYNIDKEPPESWSPDKLAVFLARKLNAEKDSPLHDRILVAAENDFMPSRSEAKREGRWMISMATVVEGIARLVSQNPKRDSTTLLKCKGSARRRSVLTEGPGDNAPLRSVYLDGNDIVLLATVKNFLCVVEEMIWSQASLNSFIVKTVGLQALFDLLRKLAAEGFAAKDLSEKFFAARLKEAALINFSGAFFQNASGSGRQRIRTCLELRLGLKDSSELKPDDRDDYLSACGMI